MPTKSSTQIAIEWAVMNVNNQFAARKRELLRDLQVDNISRREYNEQIEKEKRVRDNLIKDIKNMFN